MSDTVSTLPSQPTGLVARFEPARAVCAPKACYRGKRCWVLTARIKASGYGCYSCGAEPELRGNEAKHAAVLRRCLASQNEASP